LSDVQKRLGELPEHLAEPPADDDERSQANALFHRALETVRAEFEPRTWDAIWRTVVAGEDTSVVAESLGMSKNGVRLAKSRVLRRARVLLGDCAE
jgi:RNA polymerase sigma-70 factor (ECF subfamily)